MPRRADVGWASDKTARHRRAAPDNAGRRVAVDLAGAAAAAIASVYIGRGSFTQRHPSVVNASAGVAVGSTPQPSEINLKPLTALVPLLAAALIPLAAHADVPGKHPYYLHALTDLRAARWLLEHRPGDARVSADEDVAIVRIDEAINEIKHAAIDDGKDLQDHPPVDAKLDHKGRLHRAEELLRKVHGDIAREEDDPLTRGLRDRAVHHVDDAMHATHKAIEDAGRGI